MPMKNHPHPGRIVRQDCLEPFNLTVTEAAKVLGVARQALNSVVNERAGISPEMAVRLAKAFGSGPRCGYASRQTTTCPASGKRKLAFSDTGWHHSGCRDRSPFALPLLRVKRGK